MANLQTGSTQGLEQLTSYGDPFLSPARLAPWLSAVERQVCQVRVGSMPLVHGTGFLIAPDLVLTCYHVVKGLLEGAVSHAHVQVRFDYREANEWEPADEDGLWIDLDDTWEIPFKPTSAADKTLQGEPELHELDFAVLKLAQPVGLENIPGTGTKRGWIDLSQEPPAPAAPIIIVQHPSMGQYPPQEPVKLAIGNDPVRLNGNGTRVSYPTSTMPGSSGAPVFDRSLRAIALHHRSGEPKSDGTGLVLNNRGIPLRAIRAALSEEVRALLKPPPARPAAAQALHTLRAPTPDFTGRSDDIETLVNHLSQEGATATIAGIRGMGGIGKTELALVVAHRLADRYPDAQLMYELQPGNTPLTPVALLGQLVHAFKPDMRLPDNQNELESLARSLLAGKRGLLLFDNVAGAQQVRPLVPPPAGWAVLVTSRTHFRLRGGRLFDLGLLPSDEAKALLLTILTSGAREEVRDANLERLATLCGRLPLALCLAGGFLTSYPNWTIEDYLLELEKERLKYLEAPDEESVRTVLGFSIERLCESDEALAQRWYDLAVFPAPFDHHAAAAIWETEPNQARTSLGALVQRSLVEYDGSAYRVHDLLREIALEKSLSAEVRYRHAMHYLVQASKADRLYQSGGDETLAGLRFFDACLPHLLHSWQWLQVLHTPAALRWVSEFSSRLSTVLGLRIKPADRIELLERAVEAARQLGDRPGEGAHLGNLGLAQAELGQTRRAINCFEQALAICREIGDRRGEGAALGSLGSAYAALGQVGRGIKYQKRALAISRGAGDRRNEGANLGNLGSAYAVLGEAGRAIKYHEQALVISHEIGDRRAEGAHLGNLGLAYADLGHAERAIKHYEQALAISLEIGDRHNEAVWLGNLGLAYATLGKTEQAIEYCEQALAVSREIGDRYGEGVNVGNVGFAHARAGQISRAIEYYEPALEISREIGDRQNEATWLGLLGLAYAALGITECAIEHHEQALAISREIEDRRGEAIHSWNLGEELLKAGDLKRATQLMQVLVDYEREIGHACSDIRAAQVEAIRNQIAEAQAEKDGPSEPESGA